MLQIFQELTKNSKMADERKSWISQVVAEELISESVDRAVLGAEGSEDGTTVVGMLATKVEEVRPLKLTKRITLN